MTNKIIIKNSIDSFSLSIITYIYSVVIVIQFLIDCEYCNKLFNEKENVYCNNGKTHICEKCYDKIKGDKND